MEILSNKYAKFNNEIQQNSRLRKGKGQEGPGRSRYLKRLSNKYGKNSKNNKRNQILDLERKRAKGLEKSAKIAKVTRIFIAIIKKTLTNIESMPRITNFANVHNIRLQQLLTEYYLIYVYANPFILNNN